jgi:hypothetical protein
MKQTTHPLLVLLLLVGCAKDAPVPEPSVNHAESPARTRPDEVIKRPDGAWAPTAETVVNIRGRSLHKAQLEHFKLINKDLGIDLLRRDRDSDPEAKHYDLKIPGTFYCVPAIFDFKATFARLTKKEKELTYEKLLAFLNYKNENAVIYSTFLLCYLGYLDNRLVHPIKRILESGPRVAVNNSIYLARKIRHDYLTHSLANKISALEDRYRRIHDTLQAKHKEVIAMRESPVTLNIGGPQFYPRVGWGKEFDVVDEYHLAKSVIKLIERYQKNQ